MLLFSCLFFASVLLYAFPSTSGVGLKYFFLGRLRYSESTLAYSTSFRFPTPLSSIPRWSPLLRLSTFLFRFPIARHPTPTRVTFSLRAVLIQTLRCLFFHARQIQFLFECGLSVYPRILQLFPNIFRFRTSPKNVVRHYFWSRDQWRLITAPKCEI